MSTPQKPGEKPNTPGKKIEIGPGGKPVSPPHEIVMPPGHKPLPPTEKPGQKWVDPKKSKISAKRHARQPDLALTRTGAPTPRSGRRNWWSLPRAGEWQSCGGGYGTWLA